MLSSLKGALFLFLFISVTLADPASVGYYLDKSYNLVQVPILELPLYLKNSSVIGVSSFFNHLNTSGWTYLQIETNPSFSDYQQMYAAGYLEGSSTYELIWDAWNNFNEFMLNNASFVSSKAQAFVNNQTNWILETVQANPEDPYWNFVNASLAQQNGLYDGYVNQIQKANRTDMSLTYDQFYYLTNMGDLEDIIPAFNVSVKKSMECSAFFRLTEDDLIAAHSTFNIYSLMLRVFKSYHIPLNNPLVKVKTLMFSSRPGDLESKDDFYMLDNGLVVVETSLNNFNVSLYNDIHYAALPAWMRNLMANRIAGSGEEWAEYFFMNRSGTHNNQWIVLDYNKYDTYKNNITSAEGIVWMIEEYYSLQSAIDVTQELLVSQGYVAGYNVPYNQSIYNISGYTTGYGYNYTTDPRAVLFKKYGPETETIGSVKDLMRYNNVNDTGDVCSAIAPRCDLLDKGAFIFGAIDGKVTNRELMKTMVSHIVSGPTTENLPAFNWDHWPDTAHRGMPPLFDFDWLLYKAIVGPLSIDEDIISI